MPLKPLSRIAFNESSPWTIARMHGSSRRGPIKSTRDRCNARSLPSRKAVNSSILAGRAITCHSQAKSADRPARQSCANGVSTMSKRPATAVSSLLPAKRHKIVYKTTDQVGIPKFCNSKEKQGWSRAPIVQSSHKRNLDHTLVADQVHNLSFGVQSEVLSQQARMYQLARYDQFSCLLSKDSNIVSKECCLEFVAPLPNNLQLWTARVSKSRCMALVVISTLDSGTTELSPAQSDRSPEFALRIW